MESAGRNQCFYQKQMQQTSDVWHQAAYIKERGGFLCSAATSSSMIHHGFIQGDAYYGTGRVNSDSGFSCSRSTPNIFPPWKKKTYWPTNITLLLSPHYHSPYWSAALRRGHSSEPQGQAKLKRLDLVAWSCGWEMEQKWTMVAEVEIKLKPGWTQITCNSATSREITPRARGTVKHTGTKCMNSSTEEENNPNLGPSKLV